MSIKQMGQESQPQTPLQRLRRFEMVKVAKAYNIRYKEGSRKDKMVVVMQDAMDEGVFAMETLISKAPFPHFITGQPDPRLGTPEVTKVDTPVSDEPFVSMHLGMAMKWCVMQGDKIIHKGLKNKEEADGLHIPTSG